jgi:hypothetical protein
MSVTRNLKQDVTIWASAPGDYGSETYGAPSVVKGRWEERAENFIDPHGQQQVSRAVVFLAADVGPGDYIYLGTSVSADPTLEAGAYKVRQFSKIPDLRNLQSERRAYL